MNIIETVLNLLYLYLAHVTFWPAAPLIGFTSAVMTLAKTMLYILNEAFCGWCSLRNLPFQDLLLYWIIPNGLAFLNGSAIIIDHIQVLDCVPFPYRPNNGQRLVYTSCHGRDESEEAMIQFSLHPKYACYSQLSVVVILMITVAQLPVIFKGRDHLSKLPDKAAYPLNSHTH